MVRVRVAEPKGKAGARAELRAPPAVQGRCRGSGEQDGPHPRHGGRLLLSVEPAQPRHPGASAARLRHQAAHLSGRPGAGAPAEHPRLGRPGHAAADRRGRTSPARGIPGRPKNYDGGASGILTLRRALENSKNLVTARLLDGGIETDPEQSLRRVCELALEAQLYVECVPHYPFVLGAQPVRILDLAAFYAAIANEGAMPTPYAFETVDEGGRSVYRRRVSAPVPIGSADRAAFYQLRTMLQGVLARGTARSLRALAPYVAGKTGTSDNENDAWFVGFTNDVTVAVWVGYDNADGKRRTLGGGQTGAKVAIPIFRDIVEAAWAHHAPKAELGPPSPQAARQLIALPIDLETGERITEWERRLHRIFPTEPVRPAQGDAIPARAAGGGLCVPSSGPLERRGGFGPLRDTL